MSLPPVLKAESSGTLELDRAYVVYGKNGFRGAFLNRISDFHNIALDFCH